MDNETKWELIVDPLVLQIEDIRTKEPEMAQALEILVKHIHDTYLDKYSKGEKLGINTKEQLYSENGKFINVFQVTRYLQRYVTEGSIKSGLMIDLFKGIHYMLFEIVRRIKNDDLEIKETKL